MEQFGLTPVHIGHTETHNIYKALSLDILFDIALIIEAAPQKFLAFKNLYYIYYNICHRQQLSLLYFFLLFYL